jgi:2',3'-cyclic-nucleotide 2'-phosphodiesterase / 3'-nucleotidase
LWRKEQTILKALKQRLKQLFTTVTTAAVILGASVGTTPIKVAAETGRQPEETKITLLGTSDIHGRFVPWDYDLDGANTSGSLTQLQTIVKQVRAENPNTILVDIGDMIQGNSAELFNDYPMSSAATAMNAMGYELWTMGNHEFDFGLDVLKKITGQFNGGLLAGNVYKENGERYFPAHHIIEKAGIKIGFIGMTTPMTAEFKKGSPKIAGIEFRDPVIETQKAIDEIENKVDVMVGIMHMGVDNENGVVNTGVTDIANANPELTAMFAGHMHKLVKSQEINGVLVTEPDKYGTHISRIDLTFIKQNGEYVLKDRSVTALPVKAADGTIVKSDEDLEKLLQPYHNIARENANTVVAELKGMNMVPQNEIKGIPNVQIQETPLAAFFNEVMLHYGKTDVVAHQIDNDHAKLDVGAIKKKDISYNYQYAGGEVSVYKISGKDLKDYMEWSAGYFNQSRPGDVTISFDQTRRASKYSTNDFFGGITYEIDLTEPYGSRIKNIKKLDGTPINLEDHLTIGMNAYRMDFLVSKSGPMPGRSFEKVWSTQDESSFGDDEGTIRRLAIRYLTEVKNGVYTAVQPNNWKIVGVDMTSKAHKEVAFLVNKDILTVPKTADGKYTNVASINVSDPITQEEINELSIKANVDPSEFVNLKAKGEFYSLLAEKLGGTFPDDGDENGTPIPAPEKETGGTKEPAKADPTPIPSKDTAVSKKQTEQTKTQKLPNTATNIYNLLGVGSLLLIIGAIWFVRQRRESMK